MGYSVLLFALFSIFLLPNPALAADKAYVVYLGETPGGILSSSQEKIITESHQTLFAGVLGISKLAAQKAIYYSSARYISWFAAVFDEKFVAEISKNPKVVSVFEERKYQLRTTRSWDFLGLPENSPEWKQAKFGNDTIIAHLDTGVWPESPSFRDDGSYTPISPPRWRGTCDTHLDATYFSCNNKLIGARYFNFGYKVITALLTKNLSILFDLTLETPRDTEGHGSHTLSTAGGNFVPNANIFGQANGTAKGGSPRARVATYKVCWGGGCFSSDILMGFISAIEDGVDVLSVSLGGPASDYLTDVIAIGSFIAVKNKIPVVCAAGNSGPTPGSDSNVAPWIFTVAASTMDREFPSYVSVGDVTFKGQSLSDKSLTEGKLYPIIISTDATAQNRSITDAQLCLPGSLDTNVVQGKIVVCMRGTNPRVEKGLVVFQAGGVGMVLINDPASGNGILADPHFLPATHLTYDDGQALLPIVQNSNSNAEGFITKPETKLDVQPAPVMASFSSQGPNPVTPEILKPDITAPGVSVLAAFTGATSPTGLADDTRRVLFNVESGTSMACPHVAGVVGLLKTLYPTWSPAALKSAIMTTATILDNKNEHILNSSLVTGTPFSFGSGQVNPSKVVDPGLVYDYDLSLLDLLTLTLGCSSTQVSLFRKFPFVPCPDFNYPSITIIDLSSSVTVSRTLTNVGSAGTYNATVENPTGVQVTVTPNSLVFATRQQLKYDVKFEKIEGKTISDYVFGSLTWTDGVHNVRSPLVVKIKG